MSHNNNLTLMTSSSTNNYQAYAPLIMANWYQPYRPSYTSPYSKRKMKEMKDRNETAIKLVKSLEPEELIKSGKRQSKCERLQAHFKIINKHRHIEPGKQDVTTVMTCGKDRAKHEIVLTKHGRLVFKNHNIADLKSHWIMKALGSPTFCECAMFYKHWQEAISSGKSKMVQSPKLTTNLFEGILRARVVRKSRNAINRLLKDSLDQLTVPLLERPNIIGGLLAKRIGQQTDKVVNRLTMEYQKQTMLIANGHKVASKQLIQPDDLLTGKSYLKVNITYKTPGSKPVTLHSIVTVKLPNASPVVNTRIGKISTYGAYRYHYVSYNLPSVTTISSIKLPSNWYKEYYLRRLDVLNYPYAVLVVGQDVCSVVHVKHNDTSKVLDNQLVGRDVSVNMLHVNRSTINTTATSYQSNSDGKYKMYTRYFYSADAYPNYVTKSNGVSDLKSWRVSKLKSY